MQRKKWFVGLLCFGIIAGLTACGGAKDGNASAGGSVNLKMSVTTGDTSVWQVATKEFARLVEEGTEGRYTISVYPNEQLAGGNMDKATEMILDGTVDCDLRSITNFTNYEPKLYASTMPWVFTDGYESVDQYIFEGEGGKNIKELVEAKGIHVLGLAENGFRQVTNNKHAITSPDDMKFLKMRVPAMSIWMDTFKTLGADPTSMSFSEVFTALQQGTIDGQENPTDPIASGKIHEVQKYMTKWNYAYDCLLLSVSDKTWNALSEEDKAIFQSAAEQACKAQIEANRAAEEANFKLFEEAGMEITELTDEQTAVFREAVQPLYDQYRETVTDEVFAKFGYTFEN